MSAGRDRSRRRTRCAHAILPGVLGGMLVAMGLLLSGCGEHVPAPAHRGSSRITQVATIDRFPAGLGAESARGRAIFLRKCRVCHGDAGNGKGFNAFNVEQTFGVRPVDFTAISRWTAEMLADARAVIQRGGPSRGLSAAMPAWGGRLDNEEVEQVLAFLQALGTKEGPG